MGMDNRKTSGGSFVAALVFFVMTASIAIFLLLTALVVWLSEVTGSFILSTHKSPLPSWAATHHLRRHCCSRLF